MIEVRELRAGDLPAVRGLLGQLAAQAGEGDRSARNIDVEALFLEMSGSPRFYQNWVAVEGERVIGFLSLIFYRTLFHAGGTALVNELIVDRDRRGGGVGRLLMDRAVAEARGRGMDEIEVGTETDNAAARRFYKKNGFDGEYVLLGMEFHDEAER